MGADGITPGTFDDVDAFDLLWESEEQWSADIGTSLRGDGSVDSRHRRKLVLEALRGYDRLRDRDAPHVDPQAVFDRWPACTLVALVEAAASATGQDAFRSQLTRFLNGDPGVEAAAYGDDLRGPATTDAQVDAWLRAWSVCWRRMVEEPGHRPVEASALQDVPGLAVLLVASGLLDVSEGMPELRLDVHSGSVFLTLPAGASGGWTLYADGATCQATGDLWHLPRPVRSVDCVNLLGERRAVSVVDPADPLLVFDEDGRAIPATESLPAAVVWLLHPGEPPTDAFDGSRRILEQAVPPPGWEQWWLGRVALDHTSAVRSYTAPETGVSAVPGEWRHVSRHAVAVLVSGSVVEGLFDDGGPVYAAAPRVDLPVTAADCTWTVEVGRCGDAEPLARRDVVGGGSLDLADILPRPVLGRFEITVRGSRGRPLRRTVTVAEDVVVHCDPRLRMFTRTGGLYSATVEVSGALRSVPYSVHLGRRETGRTIELGTVGAEARSLRLQVIPPHMTVRPRMAAGTGAWGVQPLDVTPDDLAADARVEIRLPDTSMAAGGVPHLVAGYGLGSPIQYVDGKRVSGGQVFRYALSKLTDTARRHGSLDVWLDLPGQQALVAIVREAAAAHGVHCDGTVLRLLDRRPHGRLNVRLYAVLAPWLPPERVELDEADDAVVLAPSFRHVGPLLATVRRAGTVGSDERGWPSVGPTARVRADELVFRAESAGIPLFADPTAQSVVNYLAGRAELPEDPNALPLLWVAAGRADALSTRGECAVRLGVDPSASLSAAADSRLSSRELVVALIRSGLVAHRFRQVPDLGRVPAVWAAAPLPALLLTSPLLPYLAGGRDWDRAELEPEEDVLLREVEHRCGPVPLDLLAGRGLREPGRSSFGSLADAERMRQLPRAQLDDIVRSLGLVPRWPLDPDSRFLAMFEAFAARDELRDLPDDLPEYQDAIQTYASGLPHEGMARALRERGVPSGIGRAYQWLLTPALSLGFALLARQAAQGSRTAAALERQTRPVWARLAECAPELAVQDIQLAEFMVSGWHARDDP